MIARRWLELINEHKIEELCEMTAPNWRTHGGPPGGLPPGADGIRELFRQIGPIEQEFTIEDSVAEGDKVVVRLTGAYKRASSGYPVMDASRRSARCSFTGSAKMGRSSRPGETPMI